MEAAWIALGGLLLTVLGAVAGAAMQHGVSKEKVRSLESRMAAAEARQEAMKDRLSRGDANFAELRAVMSGMNTTLSDIKADIEKLVSRD